VNQNSEVRLAYLKFRSRSLIYIICIHDRFHLVQFGNLRLMSAYLVSQETSSSVPDNWNVVSSAHLITSIICARRGAANSAVEVQNGIQKFNTNVEPHDSKLVIESERVARRPFLFKPSDLIDTLQSNGISFDLSQAMHCRRDETERLKKYQLTVEGLKALGGQRNELGREPSILIYPQLPITKLPPKNIELHANPDAIIFDAKKKEYIPIFALSYLVAQGRALLGGYGSLHLTQMGFKSSRSMVLFNGLDNKIEVEEHDLSEVYKIGTESTKLEYGIRRTLDEIVESRYQATPPLPVLRDACAACLWGKLGKGSGTQICWGDGQNYNLTEVIGIGSDFQQIMDSIGIYTRRALIEANPEDLAKRIKDSGLKKKLGVRSQLPYIKDSQELAKAFEANIIIRRPEADEYKTPDKQHWVYLDFETFRKRNPEATTPSKTEMFVFAAGMYYLDRHTETDDFTLVIADHKEIPKHRIGSELPLPDSQENEKDMYMRLLAYLEKISGSTYKDLAIFHHSYNDIDIINKLSTRYKLPNLVERNSITFVDTYMEAQKYLRNPKGNSLKTLMATLGIKYEVPIESPSGNYNEPVDYNVARNKWETYTSTRDNQAYQTLRGYSYLDCWGMHQVLTRLIMAKGVSSFPLPTTKK
jgi:hypothetical protein